MSQATFDRRDYADTWSATCPKCEANIDPSKVTCENCQRKGKLQFFREIHCTKTEDDKVLKEWTECGFECGVCGFRLKAFPCPHDDGAIITLPCTRAYIVTEGVGIKGWACGLITLLIGLSISYLATPVDGNARLLSVIGSMVVAFFVAHLVPKSKAWSRYER